MPLIRHPRTGAERTVPAAAVPFFPDYEVIGDAGGITGDLPPRGGAGSGKDAWAAYAARNSVEVAEDATRDDIIAALDEAGVPTGDKE